MREWLNFIVDQPCRDFFFVSSSVLARAFSDFKKASISECFSKAARHRKWTLDFVTDKIALLVELNHDVVEEQRTREMVSRKSGKAHPLTQPRRKMREISKIYDDVLIVYNDEQCIAKNVRMKTPSLNYQNLGQLLQDSVLFLFDPLLRDLTACPVCLHLTTQRLESRVADNETSCAAATTAGGDGTFVGKSSKHGCFCHVIHCHGLTTGGNCPDCVVKVKNGYVPAIVGPGECPFDCAMCRCMCKVVFEEQHRHTIAIAIEKERTREGAGMEAPCKEKALAVFFFALLQTHLKTILFVSSSIATEEASRRFFRTLHPRPRMSYILALDLLRQAVSSGCLCKKTSHELLTLDSETTICPKNFVVELVVSRRLLKHVVFCVVAEGNTTTYPRTRIS